MDNFSDSNNNSSLQSSSSEAPYVDIHNWYLRVILKENKRIRGEFTLRGYTEQQVDAQIRNLTTNEELTEQSEGIFDCIHNMYSLFPWDDNQEFHVEYIKGVY